MNIEKPLHRNRDFMLLIVGKIVSNIGNALFQVAVIWHIMSIVSESESGMALAIFSACSAIPLVIFAPFTGVIADKMNRKVAIVGSDICRGILLLLLIVANNYSFYPLTSLYVTVFIMMFFSTLFSSAVTAVIPNVVPESQLMKANAINGVVLQLMYVIGAALAGFIYSWVGMNGILLIDGVTFILSGVSELFIRIPSVKRSLTVAKQSFMQDFKDGLKYMMNKKMMLHLGLVAIVLNFLANPLFAVLLPKIVKYDLARSAADFGILESFFSVGAIIGMLIITRIPKFDSYFGFVFKSLFIQSIAIGSLAIPAFLAVSGIISSQVGFIMMISIALVMAVMNAFVNVPIQTLFQTLVDDEMRGRFNGMFLTIVQGLVPVGLALYGMLSVSISNWLLVLITGGLLIVTTLSMLFSKELREI